MLDRVNPEQRVCYHCGLPVVESGACFGELAGATRVFCCPACRAVADTIHNSGLGDFYRYNEQIGQAGDAALINETYASLDDALIRQQYVYTDGDSEGTRVLVGGIHCSACVWLLEKYLSALPGVESVNVSLNEQVAHIRWRAGELQLSTLFRAIASLGYEPQLYTPDSAAALQKSESQRALRRLGVAGIAMMQVGMFAIALYAGALQGIDPLYRDYLRWISALVATPVVLYSAQPFFIGAWRGVKLRAPGMDLPVAIAIGLAYGASLRATWLGEGEVYFDSVAMFTFLLLAGRYLEMRARHRNGLVRSDLYSLLPALVTRIDRATQSRETIPLVRLQVGDEVLVKAGQVVPADGVVVAGQGSVNESHLTGEFIPVPRHSGDEVIAGSINESGAITVSVQAVGAGLKLQVVNALLARAQAAKPRLAQLADRFASVFVVAVLGLALLTWGYWHYLAAPGEQAAAFWVMLSVLVVSCPCALSLATPAAMTAATHCLRQLGMLVTDAQVWEKTAHITDVVCDKTGTLTRGELSVNAVIALAQRSPDDCLALAAAIEQVSEHPIASAFARDDGVWLDTDAVAIAEGRGIEARIDQCRYRIGAEAYVRELFSNPVEQPEGPGMWILLGSEEGPQCWFQLRDRLRDDADQCVQALKGLGLKLHMLSGDSSGSADQIGRELGFDDCRSGVTPAQKLAYVSDLQARGGRVLMIGDGLNDIPVLAAADISVAMANASNLAKTQADAIALSGQLLTVVSLLELAARTRRVIRQNLGWALVYNIVAIPLAAMALVPPYLAAVGMSLSSLVVVANALRLQRIPRTAGARGAHSMTEKTVG